MRVRSSRGGAAPSMRTNGLSLTLGGRVCPGPEVPSEGGTALAASFPQHPDEHRPQVGVLVVSQVQDEVRERDRDAGDTRDPAGASH